MKKERNRMRNMAVMSMILMVALIWVMTGCSQKKVSEGSVVDQTTVKTLQAQVVELQGKLEKEKGEKRYNLDVDTASDIVIYGGAWGDWWVNAPKIHQYKVEPPYKIGFITGWRGNPWQEVTIAEFKREVERSPLITSFVHMDSASDVDTQIANLEGMFTMWKKGELDAILVDPLDVVALNSTIEKIYDAGCPIVLFNNAINSTKYTCCVTDDPKAYGVYGAEWLAKELNYKGDIFFFRGVKGYPIDEGRSGGALEVFKKYPDINIVAIEYAEWSSDIAKKKFFDMQAAHPKFDGIYSVGGQMSLAIIDGMLELGLNPADYPHASEDQNGFLMKCIEHGIPSFVSCHPSISSAISVKLLEMLLQGYPVPKLYYFPTPIISSDEFGKYVRPNTSEGMFIFTPLEDALVNSIIK